MSRRVLIVEDNDQNLYLVTFLLERHGFDIVAARAGEEALQWAARERFAVIILDIQLPDLDGHTVAARLRAMPGLTGVPIVAVTSYAMPGDRERALAAGCTGYIEKPINPTAFAAQIQDYITLSASGGGMR